MSRPKKNRLLCQPPIMQGFKPFGMAIGTDERIVLQYDEYEAVKLLNYDNLSQHEAAEKINVSQSTIARIYTSALSKIAQALVEGKTIEIAGGSVEYTKTWYRCGRCFKLIQGVENHFKCESCEYYGNEELLKIE